MEKDEIIRVARADTSYRTSILGFAQINCPLAYAEYHKRKRQEQRVFEYFQQEFGWTGDERENFRKRETAIINGLLTPIYNKDMRIIWIQKLQETDKYHLTEAKFKTWLGKEFISTCITAKGISSTKYFETGHDIPQSLWTSFLAFLDSDMNYIQL